jgi:hypothetical protein
MDIENMLGDLPPEQHFWARNGAIIKSIPDLKDALEKMDDSTFYYHVNDNKNDLSAWVRHVFKDIDLAEEMSNCRDKEELIKLLGSKINPVDLPPEKPKVPQMEEIQKNPIQDEPLEEPEMVLERTEVEEILRREREIEKKEEKIKEIEDKIEKRLELIKNPQPIKFFTKEFVQGVIAGILLAVLSVLIYIKFYL